MKLDNKGLLDYLWEKHCYYKLTAQNFIKDRNLANYRANDRIADRYKMLYDMALRGEYNWWEVE